MCVRACVRAFSVAWPGTLEIPQKHSRGSSGDLRNTPGTHREYPREHARDTPGTPLKDLINIRDASLIQDSTSERSQEHPGNPLEHSWSTLQKPRKHLRDTSENTPETPQKHLRNTSGTPQKHPRNTPETPRKHHRNTTDTPQKHRRNTPGTPQKRARNTTETR